MAEFALAITGISASVGLITSLIGMAYIRSHKEENLADLLREREASLSDRDRFAIKQAIIEATAKKAG